MPSTVNSSSDITANDELNTPFLVTLSSRTASGKSFATFLVRAVDVVFVGNIVGGGDGGGVGDFVERAGGSFASKVVGGSVDGSAGDFVEQQLFVSLETSS
jgi:hypothetical protein